MKIHVASKKVPTLDAFSTLTPLNNALKIFGLSCVYRDESSIKYFSPVWILSMFILLFFIANVYSICIKLQNDDGRIHFNFKDTIQMAYLLGYVQYISDGIFVYKYGRQAFVDYFVVYDYIDSILGKPYYEKIKRSISKMCIFFIVVAVLSTIIDYVTWIENADWYYVGVYIIEYIYLTIRMLGALDIIANCIQVKYRLKTIGDLLENYYSDTDYLPSVVKNFIYDGVWIRTESTKNINQLDSSNSIIFLKRCYILLNGQCDFINAKYGARVLLGCLIYVLDMVLLLNLVIRILMETLALPSGLKYLVVLSTSVRIATYSVILLCAINRCEENYRQTERIVRFIDHLLVTKKITKEINVTLKELKDLIISKPVNYHAIHFYRLDYTTLVSMASFMVTYTIILLQSLQ